MCPALELLQQYRATPLVSELAVWERVRAAVSPPRYQPPPHANARTVIVLDGIPGAGKSTTQRWLMPSLGASHFSMARFADGRGVSADERLRHQLSTGHPHPVDEAFLDGLARAKARYLLLEKFPRSVIEAVAMLRAAREHGWRFEVLHLQLPGDCVALSTQRQLERGPHHGCMPEPGSARHRALVHLARTTPVRETLRAAGVPIHGVDMTAPPEESAAAIRRGLGLDVQALGWHREPLEVLERVAGRLSLEAWVSSGALYRPFWNHRYGPAQQPTDVDVAIDEGRAVERLEEALRDEAPAQRWSVLAPADRLRERWGIETRTAAEAKAYATFLHRAGLARLRAGRVELVLAPGAEAALWSGTVSLNPALVERLTKAQHAELLQRHTHHVQRAVLDYPGVAVDAELLEGHAPRPIGATWRVLKAAATQRQGTAAFCRRALGPEEKQLAQQILRFHQQRDFTPEAPPLPPRAKSPPPPGGLHELAARAGDAAFGEWFLDQVHHHRPRGGADPYLRSVLDLSLFRPLLRTLHREQSPMHQGWPLERHLAQSVLQLRTDALLAKLSAQHEARWRTDLRLSMRMAMLFHDTGKLLGQRPRRHAAISARLFARLKPRWFPERLLGLTQWLIRTHDLFGAFGRGLTEKRGQPVGEYGFSPSLSTSYFGALDSQAVRAVLLEAGLPLAEAAAINRQLWCADVGAIATLRWLLPVAELVERLLLAGNAATEAAHDRRKRQGLSGPGRPRRRP